MKDANNSLFDATFKFIVQCNVRQVNLSNMQLQDGQLYQIAQYLQTVPPLRSLILSNNDQITDDGLIRIISALSNNNKLAHIAFQSCPQLTDDSLEALAKVLNEDNMMVCQVDLDQQQFKSELVKSVQKEALLNKAIQESLKPTFYSKVQQQRPDSAETHDGGPVQDRIFDRHKRTEEVVFQESAEVNKYMQSAIKVWRIAQPRIIQIEKQKLTDRHIQELCEFLKNRNLIHKLNLRRNKITNNGALILIDWMLLHDISLTSLDVSRNRISLRGAQAFLKALKKLTRIVDFQIEYGNPIPIEVGLAISYEIQANNQIKTNQVEMRAQNNNSKVTFSSFKYELIDRGPAYMRCAIKSVELLKITYLSLPDNMLGIDAAKMLAEMIKDDPPLRILNLESNNLDAQCAKLLGEAFETNSNLQWLNISKNKLSDIGISYLAQSLIRARLQNIKQNANAQIQSKIEHQSHESNHTQKDQEATIHVVDEMQDEEKDLESVQKKDTLQSQLSRNETPAEHVLNKSPVLTDEIERCETGQLKILNLLDNVASEESYKSIQTLLEVCPDIAIIFDSPSQLRQSVLQLQSQTQTFTKQSTSKVADESSLQLIKDDSMLGENDVENQFNLMEEHDQMQAEEVVVKQRPEFVQNLINRYSKAKEKMIKVSSFACCFNKEKQKQLGREEASVRLACCWRVSSWKHSVLEFKPEPQTIMRYDRNSVQYTILTVLALNQLGLYTFIVLPFIVRQPIIQTLVALYLGYLLAFEVLVVLASRFIMRFNILNPYLWLQICSGLLKKATVLALGLICSQVSQNEGLAEKLVGFICISSVILDQYKILKAILQAMPSEKNALYPNVERTQKVAELLNFQGIVTVLRKITFLPSSRSLHLCQKIEHELNPDLLQPPAVGFLPKIREFCLKVYQSNNRIRHMLLIDLLLLAILILSFAIGCAAIDLVFLVSCLVLAFDTLYCLVEETEENVDVFKNANKVFLKANERNSVLLERYIEVLMRERVVLIHEEKQSKSGSNSNSEENSMFDTNEQDLVNDKPIEIADETPQLKTIDESLAINLSAVNNVDDAHSIQVE